MQQNSMQLRKRKRRKGKLIGAFILFFFVVGVISIIMLYKSNISSDAILNGEGYHQNESKSLLKHKGDLSQPKSKEWALTLVNRWNPIQDSKPVEVTTLENGEKVDSRIYPFLQEMFDDMREEGVYPIVASGYRTQEEQQEIYDKKYADYKAEGFSDKKAKNNTEKWVAIPGTSEHQLGLGVDINADGIQSAGYQVYNWLEKNAHKYGFIYRYPEDKEKITGVKNEPWHYRFVGEKAATEIYRKGICLEEYLDSASNAD